MPIAGCHQLAQACHKGKSDSLLVLALVAGVTVLLDQITKFLVIWFFPLGRQVPVLPDCFSLVHWRNTGAAWGLFNGHPILLALISVAVLAALVLFAERISEGGRVRALALGLIAGGIAGNLFDRLFRGAVVDFLLCYYRSFQWPAFNVADSAITVGVAIYLLASFFHASPPAEEPASSGQRN